MQKRSSVQTRYEYFFCWFCFFVSSKTKKKIRRKFFSSLFLGRVDIRLMERSHKYIEVPLKKLDGMTWGFTSAEILWRGGKLLVQKWGRRKLFFFTGNVFFFCFQGFLNRNIFFEFTHVIDIFKSVSSG